MKAEMLHVEKGAEDPETSNPAKSTLAISLLSLELNDTMPKLGLILLIKEMKAKRG